MHVYPLSVKFKLEYRDTFACSAVDFMQRSEFITAGAPLN